jgi:hypothetical protein
VHPTSFTTLYLGLEPMAELRIWRRSCYYFCERTADFRRRWSHHYILRRRCGLTHLDGRGQPEGGRGWRRTRAELLPPGARTLPR